MTENELLAELTKELTIPPIENNEVTAMMLALALKVNETTARRKLEAKLKDGLYSRRWVLVNGIRTIAYRKIAL